MPAPDKNMIKPLAETILKNEGFNGENSGDLAEVISSSIADSLNLFMSQMMVSPGIPCSPTATVAPGKLI